MKKRFDQLKRSGVEDLRKHFKQHPEEVLSLARLVEIVRVNKETLALFEAEGTTEFREGLSRIFNKKSFEIFKEELTAFWKGATSFVSEAINMTLAGTEKNILVRAQIIPGYEDTWVKVCVAITDITAIRNSMASLVASEQKYRSVLDALESAVLIVDMPSGVIVGANRMAKRLFGVSNSELTGLHFADLVQGEEKQQVRGLLHHRTKGRDTGKCLLHIVQKKGGMISVFATANPTEIKSEKAVVVAFAHADETVSAASAGNKAKQFQEDLAAKLTQREREILRLICSSKTSRMIAQHLGISEKTVETHRARIMQKLNAHSVIDLVKLAMTNGFARLH